MAKRVRVYTRRGDLGETGTYGGPRVGKDSPRMEMVGALDELNAHIGSARAELRAAVSIADDAREVAAMEQTLGRVQGELLQIGSEYACPDPVRFHVRTITPEHIQSLEEAIDRCEDRLPEQTTFLLPSGSRGAASLHVARTVCRRAERQVIRLMREVEEDVSRVPLAYLNRLSDMLYVFARATNAALGVEEEAWKGKEE